MCRRSITAVYSDREKADRKRIESNVRRGLLMVILVAGATHAGKTAYAQKLLEKYRYPYLSMDHLKMGLIRSGHTNLTPMSEDASLTAYLWPIVSEMIKTAIENDQNLIVEGCYVPADWAKTFHKQYLPHIRCVSLVMSEDYIRNHFEDIVKYANVVEKRLADDCSMEGLIGDNALQLEQAKHYGTPYVLIDQDYAVVDQINI